MSDPYVHLVSGSLVGGVLGTKIYRSVGYRVHPLAVAVASGFASVVVDLDHLPRFIEAGGSYTRLVLEAEKFTAIDNYHAVTLAVVAFLTFVTFLYWQSARANGRWKTMFKAGWVFCSLATLTIIVIAHIVMDEVFQCTFWPATKCGWVAG